MRCKNCGWPNKPDVTHCVKCGEPITDDDPLPMGGTIRVDNRPEPEPSNLKKTVIEAAGFNLPKNNVVDRTMPIDQVGGSSSQCPKCGYQLRPGADKCPNCNTPVMAATVRNEPEPHQADNVNFHSAPRRQTTINPYLMDMDPTPMCSLRPIKKVNEHKEPSINEYEGKDIVLERANTDPDNGSITSQGQARLTNVDGAWFIEDMSEQKTSFLQVARKTEIKDGDIILLGNRLFEFHT